LHPLEKRRLITAHATGGPSIYQLDRLEGVRVEMARVYREMEAGTRDSQEGSRLVYVLTAIAKVLELTEIEHRLARLEDRAQGKLPGAA